MGDLVVQGLVDVAFLWLPADTSGLHTAVVATEERMVARSASPPLAARPALTLADLRDEPILWNLGPASMAAYTHPELIWRPVTDLDPLRIAVAWPRTSVNPLVPACVRAVRALATEG
ncbi:LysR substrate-binding domain-containing protein [Nocardia puris]|uniref:LysR substrate-binding domain-containing protein n=1 Tax=Nocardia puris TaxID=208602 RepID=UPI001E36D623|nr:LysR substrate-binding domain-containing protein [Nocardia puris]